MTLQVPVVRKLAPFLKPARYKGLHGGRGGSKSHFIAEQIVIRAYSNTLRIVCIREVQNSIKDSVKQLIVDKITKFNMLDAFDVLDNEIRCKLNGSFIIFKGMQAYNAANIKSLEGFDIAWVEEAQTLSQVSLDMLRPTIRKPNSELWFSWNPRYKTDPIDKFLRSNPPPESIVIQVNWIDNPWFPQELIDEMKHDFAIDPDKAEHIWNGAYGAGQGAILARWVNQAEREGRMGDVTYDPYGAPVEISADLGFRDTASFWYWQRVNGGFNVLKYDGDTGLDAEEWIPRIKEHLNTMGVKLGKIWLPHDARAKTFQSKHTTIEKFMEAFGVEKCAIVPISKKLDQIEAARTVIQKCAFNKDLCQNGIDGLTAWEFVYNDDAGTFSREPNHNWASHPSDAFAYGCQVMREFMPEPPKDDEPRGIHVGQTKVTLNELWASQPKTNSRI